MLWCYLKQVKTMIRIRYNIQIKTLNRIKCIIHLFHLQKVLGLKPLSTYQPFVDFKNHSPPQVGRAAGVSD